MPAVFRGSSRCRILLLGYANSVSRCTGIVIMSLREAGGLTMEAESETSTDEFSNGVAERQETHLVFFQIGVKASLGRAEVGTGETKR